MLTEERLAEAELLMLALIRGRRVPRGNSHAELSSSLLSWNDDEKYEEEPSKNS